MPRVLVIADESSGVPEISPNAPGEWEIVEARDPVDAMKMLQSGKFDGVLVGVSPDGRAEMSDQPAELLCSRVMLDSMSDGAALLDNQNRIVHVNRAMREWFGSVPLIGQDFYLALGNPDVQGPELTPLASCLATQKVCTSTLHLNDRYYQLNVAPVIDSTGVSSYLVVTLRDSTDFTLERQKLQRLHEAGMALADLRPQEIYEMGVEERIELLKDNILHFTKDLLNYDVVEIRLIEQETKLLQPLLSVGIDSDRSKQPLFVSPTGNGVTGFVAFSGKSYLCEDTATDPLYLDGLVGARSSLTVPLIYHDEVIGTFNVESHEPGKFSKSDLLFVETFARDIAQALNTLELLVAQQTTAAQQSVEAIHSAVALPIDEIVSSTARILEEFIGHNPDVVRRLKDILKNARDIKQVIHKVGEKMAPADAVPAGVKVDQRPALKNKHVLVVDEDESVRNSAHELLDRYGCFVETAHDGAEAISMMRSVDGFYDAIISDIRLPDMTGYDLLLKIKEITGQESPNLILMTGFGYDRGHTIVKARQAGLKQAAVLYKPFRLDQLLQVIETVIGT